MLKQKKDVYGENKRDQLLEEEKKREEQQTKKSIIELKGDYIWLSMYKPT